MKGTKHLKKLKRSKSLNYLHNSDHGTKNSSIVDGMKVLHVIDRLNIGGAEKIFVEVTKLLFEKGLDVGALLFHTGYPLDDKIDKRIKLHVLDRKNKYSLAKMYLANKICSEYDIVHVHMRYCYSYIRLSQMLFGGKYKILFHEHYGDIELNSEVPFTLKYFFKPKYFVGVSNSLTDWADKKLKVKKKNIFVLKNTIIPDKNIDYKSKGKYKKAIIVSNIREAKNLEFAFELAAVTGLDITIYGNNSDPLYYDKIMDILKSHPQVRIIEGVSDLSGVYDQYDIAFHCAKSESGPLVILEYLAYGIPFMAYRTGEVAKTIYNEIPAHFMESFEVNEWKDRLVEIQKEENIRERFNFIFDKYFSPRQYTNECIKIYESVNC
jgi:glycosyltransferase involved in cell wall biosynthesis